MKALFIGGTGTISTAIVKKLAADPLWEVWVLNRGNRNDVLPEGVHSIICDISNEEEAAAFTGGKDPEAALDMISTLCDIAVVKIGKHGILLNIF